MIFGRSKRAINSILIVEDEPLVAFDTEHALSHAGYTIVSAVDSHGEALRMMQSHAIDLIIADVGLSGVHDGIDVAREAQRRGIAVLFATAHCPVDARELALGCLAKPYSERELLAAVETADALLGGHKPGRLPRSMTLFDAVVAGIAGPEGKLA